MDVLFLIGRILFGATLAFMSVNHFMQAGNMAGYAKSKGIPAPMLAVVGSGVVLLLGALGILLGIYPKLSVLLLVVFFLPVTLMMHNFWTISDEQQKMNEMIQFMKNTVIVGAALMFLAIPPQWPYAVNAWL